MSQKILVAIVLAGLAVGGILFFQFSGEETAPSGDDAPRSSNGADIQVDTVERRDPKDDVYLPSETKVQSSDGPTPMAPQGPEDLVIGTVKTESGRPIVDARVVAFRYQMRERPMIGRFKLSHDEIELAEVRTDSVGAYRIEGLDRSAPRAFTLRVAAEGFATILKDHVGPGMTVDVIMVPGTDIVGQVTDRDDGKPLADVVVEANFKKTDERLDRAMRWRQVTRTDASGRYRFTGAPAGTISFLLEHDDYEQLFFDHDQGFTTTVGQEARFDVEMKRGLVLDALVVDRVSGKAVVGAHVTLKEMPFLPAQRETTGALGKVTMKGVKRGRNEIQITCDGFTNYSEQVEFTDKALAGEVVFKLKPAGAVSGEVVDETGLPIAGAQVFVAEEMQIFRKVRSFAEATTDARGHFVVGNLDDGRQYRFCAVAPGYVLGASVDIVAESGRQIDSVIIQIARGASVTGVIRDEVGIPVAGVQVALEQPPFDGAWFPPPLTEGQKATLTATSDGQGAYRFDGLYAGRYHITPEHEDYQQVLDKVFQIKTPNEAINQDFELRLGHGISGRVIDEFGRPVSGATVSAMLHAGAVQRIVAKTDENGQYQLKRLQDVSYRVLADSDQGVAAALDSVPADSAGVDFALLRWGEIRGRAYAAGSGAPVEKFKIRLSPTRGIEAKGGRVDTGDRANVKRMRTDEAFVERDIIAPNGEFHLPRVHPGDYILEILAEDYREYERSGVSVLPGVPTVVPAFSLTEGARFEGQFVDSKGNPLPAGSVRIRIVPPAGSARRTTIDASGNKVQQAVSSSWEGKAAVVGAEGRFAVGGLPPGRVNVHFSSDAFCMPEPAEMAFGTDKVTVERYTVEKAARVTLTIVDEAGAPISACSTEIRTADGRAAMVDGRRAFGRSTVDGKIEIEKLAPGNYTVVIGQFRYESQQLTLRLAEGDVVTETVVLTEKR